MNDAAGRPDTRLTRAASVPARHRRLSDRLEMMHDYLGRSLPIDLDGARPDDEACGEPALNVPLPGGRPLPTGHYRASIRIREGIEFMRSPILQVFSAHSARNRHVVLRRTGSSDRPALGCDVALLADAIAIRLLPDDGGNSLRPGPLHMRRLTRPEFYARLMRKALSRSTRQQTPIRSVLAGLFSTLRNNGIRALAAELRRVDQLSPQAAYEEWIRAHERLDHEKATYALRIGRATEPLPVVTVIIAASDPDPAHLTAAIARVSEQVYPSWELLVALSPSASAEIRSVLSAAMAGGPGIRVIETAAGADAAASRNEALKHATGAWVVAMAAADKLAPTALAAVILDGVATSDAALVYGDDDCIGDGGERSLPRFKPDFSRELLRSHDYMGELLFIRSDVLRDLGGWRSGLDDADHYDLALRAFERLGGTAIRHLPKVLHHRRPGAGGAGKRQAMLQALEDHVLRTGLHASIEPIDGVDAFRLRHRVAEPLPLVSLIVPTRDKVELLRDCVESIVNRTTYPCFEILVVDNGSTEPQAIAYLDELARRERVRVLSYGQPFNFSSINNFAAREARGTIIGLVNNDTVVITPEWLSEMVSWAVQPDIGCVGAKLLYGDDTIQHAGVVVGIGDVAGHVYRHFPRGHAGYCDRLKVVQNLSAVTAACLLVRKSVYEEVGGLNDSDLTVAYNDVDFCLRVGRAGYSNVWTPFAELYHLESLSRGADRSTVKARRYAAEVAYMHSHWDMADDPFYSPHLTRLREDSSVAV